MYGSIGFVEDLPELGAGRRDHACGHFVNTENIEVARAHTRASNKGS